MNLRFIITAATIITQMMVFADTIGDASKDASQFYMEASQRFSDGNFTAALTLYLKADSAYVAEGKVLTPDYAQSLHSTGRAFLNANKILEGREFTHRAMALREKLFGKKSEDYITSYNNYSLSLFMTGDNEDALKHMLEVVKLSKQLNPPHPDEGMYLINLARIYNSIPDNDNAVKHMEEALSKVEKFSQNYEYALNFLGNAYMQAEDNANMNRIMGLMDEHNRHELEKECNEPECHLDRAEYYYSTGDAAHAKDEYMAVFAMPLTAVQKATACRKYAQFLTNQRDYAQSADYYVSSAEAMQSIDGMFSGDAVELLKQAGLCYLVGKEYEKSRHCHIQVIAAVDHYGYSEKLKSTSLQGLGNALSAQKKYDEAIVAFRQWIEHLERYGHATEPDYAKAHERLASAEKFKGDFEESISHYEKAMALYDTLGMDDEKQQATDGLRMCLFYAKKDMGDYDENSDAKQQRDDKMRAIIRSSLNSLEQGGDYLGRLFIAQTYATIAGSYAQLGEYNNALDFYEKYITAIRQALAEDFILKNPRERELAWKQELSNISEMGCLMVDLPENTPDLYARLSNLIYEGQLLSKGLLLSSNIEFDKILSKHGTKEMQVQYKDIKGNLAKLQQLKDDHSSTDEILKLTRATDAMQLDLARESAKYGIFTDFLNISTEDILKALTPSAVAVEFVTLDTGILSGDDMIVAVLVSHDWPKGIAIPIGSVDQIKSIVDDKGKFENEDYTATIWGGIMQASVGKSRFYFAPDGIINNLAIEYLQVNGKPISEVIEMHRLSSTREIARKHPTQPILYASLFGDIDYIEDGKPATDKRKYAKRETDGVNFSRLENTGREVSEISSTVRQGANKPRVFPYIGAKASKAEFLSQSEVPVNLLHLATHGKYISEKDASDSDAMKRSILAFAGANLHQDYVQNEGVVNAYEIAGMTLQDCELAVLSACESGLGKLGNDGVFGLQRGFKNAGVKTLLVSLNEVADEATADMMIAFYNHLFDGNGKTKHEALRQAQKDIRTKYPNDPTWASFILIDSFN